MLKRYLGRLVYGMCMLAALTSCGDSKASGTGEFSTVFATASGPNSVLDSDVATWVDATTGTAAQPCLATSVPTTSPDQVTYTITSTPFPSPNTGQSSTITPSPLSITRITVTLTPTPGSVSPVLPPNFQTQMVSSTAARILPGTSAPIVVRIVDNDFKAFLMTSFGAQSITCANPATYSYNAVVSFEMQEVNTDRVATITAPGFLLVKFSDFIDASIEE